VEAGDHFRNPSSGIRVDAFLHHATMPPGLRGTIAPKIIRFQFNDGGRAAKSHIRLSCTVSRDLRVFEARGTGQFRRKLFGYSTRISFMTAPDGFWVSTSAFPFTTNSYWLLAPMANSLFATRAFVASMLAVTVYVPELR